jgi:hypothetical protein
MADYVPMICRACDGEGCSYCDLTGWVEVRPPPALCPRCEGDCCIYCGYTGWSNLRPKYPDQEAAEAGDGS